MRPVPNANRSSKRRSGHTSTERSAYECGRPMRGSTLTTCGPPLSERTRDSDRPGTWNRDIALASAERRFTPNASWSRVIKSAVREPLLHSSQTPLQRRNLHRWHAPMIANAAGHEEPSTTSIRKRRCAIPARHALQQRFKFFLPVPTSVRHHTERVTKRRHTLQRIVRAHHEVGP